ncbi:MAG: hypothetical protein WBD28_08730 [Candidatus Zixiibacteriota bacterium]
MRIYITHCSGKKDDSLKHTGKKVTPDKLYTGSTTQPFMNRCKEKQVKWAIFSDLYGVWFPNVEHEWYDKHPDTVTEQEFENLVDDFDQKLREYDEIWFYYKPRRFHRLYEKLLQGTNLKDKVKRFTCIDEIV